MSEDNKDRSGFSMNVSIGKEIDAALGDAIRGLFKRPNDQQKKQETFWLMATVC